MSENSDTLFAREERAELERVLGALTRSPRQLQLLRYLGEKYFSGEVDQLNEYNIATDILGRSKTVFNAAEDAIARVEAHRLRKRLMTYYKSEGRDHPVQVTLPAGSYVPVFVRKPAEAPPSPSAIPQTRQSSFWSSHKFKYLLTAGLIVLAIAALGRYLYLRSSSRAATLTSGSALSPIAVPSSVNPSSSRPIRLLAGYSGPPRTDSAARVWHQDQYSVAGSAWKRPPGFIARTSDSFLFGYSRTGDFGYRIPLKAGLYELHLFFSATDRSSEGVTFGIAINGNLVLQGFDINADALGENVADEQVFRDVSPDKDGLLRIDFSGETGSPTLNALEVLPGLPHAQLPIRLVMQNALFTDRRGNLWHPDDYFMNGRMSQPHPLPDSPDPDLFAGERFGHFTYAIPVDTRDTYTLVLHFAELYFGPRASGTGGTGSRVFKVMCNGQTLLDNFDIFKEAGSFHELKKTFRGLKPTAQGKLNLTFEPIKNNATVSGIEVLDESK